MSVEPTARDKCGTYAGWGAHRYAGETACDPCREAATDYQRHWRATNAEARERERSQRLASSAALRRLKALHPAEYDLFVADEMHAEANRAKAAAS